LRLGVNGLGEVGMRKKVGSTTAWVVVGAVLLSLAGALPAWAQIQRPVEVPEPGGFVLMGTALFGALAALRLARRRA
ncbi:MAG: PEP-CTERM sorting domain-containing protein, partial [Armatimonadota bacterium]|nr:PEP-CTERM sorting domain-containing protein [Armatimonadota bacterium]